MSGIDLKQVRRAISIQQVLELLNFVPTTCEGPRLRGPCPIHGDSRPRSRVFSVHLGGHRYRCFRCHSAGTQLDLWRCCPRSEHLRGRWGSLSASWNPDSVLAVKQLQPASRYIAGSLLAAKVVQFLAAANTQEAFTIA